MTMWYVRAMRLTVALAILLAPSLAAAQTTTPTESQKTWSEVQQQAAEAENTQDCAIACRALESLARATQHLCDLGPEHCDEARAKLREATERVRAACPECAAGRGAQTEAPHVVNAPPAPAGGGTEAVQAESTRGGGCAGCNTASSARDLVVPGLAALGFLVARRKRRRHL